MRIVKIAKPVGERIRAVLSSLLAVVLWLINRSVWPMPAHGINGACTLTLGCVTWGGNSTSDNVDYTKLMNTTWIS